MAKGKQQPDTTPQAEALKFGARTIVSHLDIDPSMTPARMRQMLLAAEGGDIAAQAALFERMEERDGELDAHLRTRKAGVAQADWTITPADDTAEAERAADFCRDVINDIPDVQEAIFDLLDAIPKGFAVQEVEWKHSRSQWSPIRLMYRPQRWFVLAADGRTLQLRGEGFGDAIDLNPLDFVIHRVRARSGFESRTGLLRSCARAFIVRHFAWKDWLSFGEVYGMPPRIAKLREGVAWDSEEATSLWNAVKSLGMDAYGVMRQGDEIMTLDTPAGEGQIFEMILDRAGREMTLAVLGQLLTSGGEKGGSYALGKVQNQVRWDLILYDAQSLERTLSEQLLRPIAILNLGGETPVPRWNFIVSEPEDLAQLATTVKTLGEAGLRVPASWAYEKFGIPEPEEGEEVLVPAIGGMMAAATTPARPTSQTALMQASPDWATVDELALAWLGEKRIATRPAWDALSPAGRQRAWWVTGLDERQTAQVARQLQNVLKQGLSENDFLERIESLGLSVPASIEPAAGQIPAWQARLVHRNNVWNAQNGSSYIRMRRDADVRPYGEWLCHSPCDICAPLCGNIALLNGPFYARYWPGIHHGCQCEVASRSADEIGGAPALAAMRDQSDPDPVNANPGFLFHPGDAYYIQADGGAPITDVGRQDAGILSDLRAVEVLL